MAKAGNQSVSPLQWLGSKSGMADMILSYIPTHVNYVEPFFGSGAVFFKKPISKLETINDLDKNIYNFFLCLRDKFEELQHQLQWTLYCRETHKDAMHIYKNPSDFSEIKRAWALFVALTQGFGGVIGTWGTNHNAESHGPINQDRFLERFNALRNRLESVQIENKDALEVIENYCQHDSTFLYCDPPYINTRQGQYAGYTEANYQKLLDLILTLPCQWMLSSYPNDPLNRLIADNPQLVIVDKQQHCRVGIAKAAKGGTRGVRTELLVMNYDIKPKLF